MKLALLAALVITTPLSAQTVTRVDLPNRGALRLEQGAEAWLLLAVRLRCDVYTGTTRTTKGCVWVSRNTGAATVTSGGRWTTITPKRVNAKTWVIASNNGKSDSVLITVVAPL